MPADDRFPGLLVPNPFTEDDREFTAELVRKYGVGTKWVKVNQWVWYAVTAYGLAGLVRNKGSGDWYLFYNDRMGRVVDFEADGGSTWHSAEAAMETVRSSWELRPGWSE
jgi:hypothetical protein